MKRVVVDHFGGPEVLTVVEDEDPAAGSGGGPRQGARRRACRSPMLSCAPAPISACPSRRSHPATSSSASSRNSGRAVRGYDREPGWPR